MVKGSSMMPEMIDGVEVYWKSPAAEKMRVRRRRNQRVAAWVLACVLIVTGWGMAFWLIISEVNHAADKDEIANLRATCTCPAERSAP
jgi:hypothetical protein